MLKGLLAIASACLLVSGSVLLAADEEAPATQPTAAHHRASKLIKPYSELKSLTDDQIDKIEKIHAEALETEKEARAKEQTAIDGVLTDAQKAELKAVEEKAAADRKEKAGATKKKKTGDDAPAAASPAADN
jgi:Spy/CpxP family protein refolding chaperone